MIENTARAMVLLLLLGCGGPRITGLSAANDELKFQVDGEPTWLTEEQLPQGIDPAELATLKKMILSDVDRLASERRRRRDQWLQETPAQAASEMRQKLPAGFALETHDHYVIASQGDARERETLKQLFDGIARKCRDVRGTARPFAVGPIRVYYASNEQKYKEAYVSAFGKPPTGVLGICNPEPPPRMFGLSSVGNGSAGHELVHILMMADWEAMPGWFDEGLAVAIGCPLVGIHTGKGSLSDVHLYTALQAVKQDKWTSLEQTLKIRETAYQDLDKVQVALPALSAKSVVGPLATGRMFVRWLEETGKLPAFYQSFRDSKDSGKALQAAFPGVAVAEVDKSFVLWIRGHDESALLIAPVKKD